MAASPYDTSEKKLLEALRSTELWLDRHERGLAASPSVRELIAALRRYLQHCRRHLLRGDWSSAELERRRRRINKAVILIISRQSQSE